jgi:hypothetical protein
MYKVTKSKKISKRSIVTNELDSTMGERQTFALDSKTSSPKKQSNTKNSSLLRPNLSSIFPDDDNPKMFDKLARI